MISIDGIVIQEPTSATLRRYGLSRVEWKGIGIRQGWRCAICHRVPNKGRFVIDHQHVPGWKKMSPEERKSYVRGLLCNFCNHYSIGRGMTETRAHNLFVYLREYNERSRAEAGS